MKNKKFFIITSLILVLCLALVLCACDENGDTGSNGDGGDDTPIEPTYCSVSYESADGIEFSSSNPTSVEKGKAFSFEFSVSVFYTTNPVVYVNGKEKTGATINTDDDYTFTCTLNVRQDAKISIGGIEKATSSLLSSGTGELETPFLVKEPIDLVKMAEVINSGANSSVMSVIGYYVLENDIDLRGEELPIIGDGNNNYAFFGGYFNGGGHTISNFKLTNTDTQNYVGLFGIAQPSGYDLGFTGGTIYNLKLSDYTITAKNNGSTVVCGSFVGQGFGANLILCEATNGTVNMLGDANYFSYAGGIMGLQSSYQQPYISKVAYCSTKDVNIVCSSGTTYAAGGIVGYVYASDGLVASSILNCYTTGKVSGAFQAGGIVGWLSNYTSITSCYATGDIHAQSHITDTVNLEQYCHAYAGGLVGMAQLDSVVSDSFATGAISAHASAGSAYAHKNDLVGRVEELDDGIYSAKEMSIFNSYYVKNGNNGEIDLTNTNTLKTLLGWHEIDWKFTEGSYPTINSVNSSSDGEQENYSYTVTLNYGGKTDKDGKSEYSYQINDQYESMGYWYQIYDYYKDDTGDGIPESITCSDGNVSYGYYFDSEYTLPVPHGYIPTRNVTLYVAFANNNDVAGTYYVIPNATDNTDSNNAKVELVLNVDGTYSVTDVYGTYKGTYVYNGSYVVFADARFARYYGEENLENYQSYQYKGVKTATGFNVYGALYTDEDSNAVVELVPRDNPLKVVKKSDVIVGAYYYEESGATTIFEFFANGCGIFNNVDGEEEFTYAVDGNAVTIALDSKSYTGTIQNGVVTIINSINVTPADAFRGKWELSSASNMYYEFDGAGNWEYSHYILVNDDGEAYEDLLTPSTNGTYTISDGKLVLDNGVEVTIVDGFAIVKASIESYVYGLSGGHYGVWTSLDGSTVLELKGLSQNGYGEAGIRYITKVGDRVHNEIYALTYAPNILSGDVINIFYEGEYYGSVTYDIKSGVLNGSIYSLSEAAFANVKLYRVDEYNGEWVSEDSLFNDVSFNGYGMYTVSGSVPLNGKITLNGTEINYSLDVFSLSGKFIYEGKPYNISLDEGTNRITIKATDVDITLIEKDELSGKTFLDDDGNAYVFDGRGNLTTGGMLTITGETTTVYTYVNNDGTINILENNKEIGSLAVVGEVGSRNYVLSLKDGNKNIVLGEKTAFTGEWAMASSFDDMLTIGTMNYDKKLIGSVPLSINDKSDAYEASFTMINDEYLVWTVEEGTDLYVIKLSDGLFVVSLHLNWFNYENDSDNDEWNYSYAMATDELRGAWTNSREQNKYNFDGMGKNPEALGVYSVAPIHATSDEAEPEIYYYGYFERTDESGYDFLVFNYYSVGAMKSALKVTFTTPNGSKYEYVNEAGDRAFLLESVELKNYNLNRD